MDEKSLKAFVHEKTLTWTMTTNSYKFYTLNLHKWLRDIAKVPWRLCIICCDLESWGFFRQEGIPCILYDPATSRRGQTIMAAFGTNDFATLNRTKVSLLHFFAKNAALYGIDYSLYLDGDIVVQRDPWPVLKEIWCGPEAPNYLFQCDCAVEEDHEKCGVICSGVIAKRHGGPSSEDDNLYAFDKDQWLQAERQDQPYIGNRLKTLQISYWTLPRRHWGNGWWQKTGKWKGPPENSWVLLHYNYRVGDTKKQAMKAAGHWKIPY